MSNEVTKQEFVTAEEFENASEGELSDREYTDPEPYSETAEMSKEISGLATSGNGISRISVPREVKRQRVVNAFHDAFELIGGVPRLAHWADTHPTDFFKLYARLLPAEASKAGAGVQDERPTIIHVLPRGPLDE
jgi:hypothetical protein